MAVFRMTSGVASFGDPWVVGPWLFIPSSKPATAAIRLDRDVLESQIIPRKLRASAQLPDGRWFFNGRDGKDLTAWITQDADFTSDWDVVDGFHCTLAARIDEEIFGLFEFISHDEAPQPPTRWWNGRVERNADVGLPPSTGVQKGTGSTWHNLGAVTLGDGAQVLFYDGDGWERNAAGGFEKTFALKGEPDRANDLVPVGVDGFYYLHKREVFRARRGHPPEPATPWAENVMRIAPGPEGCLLMQLGVNKRSLAMAVAFPEEGRMIPVKRKDLEPRHANEIFHGLFWSPETKRLVTVGWGVIGLEGAEILSRRRSRPRVKRG